MATEEIEIPGGRETRYRQEYEAAYREHLKRLVGFAKKMTGSKSAAKDVVQIVFMKLFETKTPPPDFQRAPLSYLFAAVQNVVISEVRKDNRRRINHSVRVDNLDRTSDAPLADDPDLEKMCRALTQIKPEWALILTLLYEEGLSAKEVAAKLGKSSVNIEVIALRAKEAMLKLMNEGGDAK